MTAVLVAYASRMGSTREIAETIGRRLEAAGLEVAVRDCADRPNLHGYDALVLGSALSPPLAARRHRLPAFGGQLDRDGAVGPISRWMATSSEIAGDFRDFDRIRAWADDIAYALTGRTKVKA